MPCGEISSGRDWALAKHRWSGGRFDLSVAVLAVGVDGRPILGGVAAIVTPEATAST